MERPALSMQLPLAFLEDEEALRLQQEVEGRRLRLLNLEWTPERLSRDFLLLPADRAAVKTGRGRQNRLGFALHLLLLRYLHFPLPTLDVVPDAVVRFVALQLRADPAALATYGRRGQTQDDHVAQIRRYLEMRAYTAHDGTSLFTFLGERALHRDDPLVLVEEAEEWLQRQQVLFPSMHTLYRLIGQAIAAADEQIQTTITAQLTPEQRTAMDVLLEQPHGRRGFVFAWLKESPRTASTKAIRDLLRKRETVLAVGVHTADLAMLNRNRVRRLAGLGRSYFNTALKRFSPDKRHTIMVCTLQDLQQSITDDIVEMLDILIGRIFKAAKEETKAVQATRGRTINSSLLVLRQAAAVVLDLQVPDPDIRPVAFCTVPAHQVQQAVDDAGKTLRPADYNSFDYAVRHYSHLRSFLPYVLEALPFTGTALARPVLEGVAVLIALSKKKFPTDAPVGFVNAAWRAVVLRPDGTLNCAMWELSLAQVMRDLLRSSDLQVVGSRQHRDWMGYLHAPQA
jgi:TnpA family transposase